MPRMLGQNFWRRLGLGVGLVLLLWAIIRAGGELAHLSLTGAHWGDLLMLAGLVGMNLFLTGALHWCVTLSFDARPPVRLGRMMELVVASALVNYLPLGWPGPAARSAYLKLRHQMPVRQSVLALGIVLGLSALLAAGVAALALLNYPGKFPAELSGGPWGGALVGLVMLTLLVPPAVRRVFRRPVVWGWAWVPLKAADLAVGAGRLWLAFRVVGHPVGYFDALMLAAADMVVSMLAFTPNGLGLSEWAVGLLAQFLQLSTSPVGQLAKLLDRAVSVLIIIPTGLWALLRLR